MNEELLKDKVRPVTDEDRENLPVYSYSSMEVFTNCPYQFNKKYNLKLRSNDTSIPLELGSLCHYILEQKGKLLANGLEVNYEKLNDTLNNGVFEIDKKTREEIPGLTKLKKKYFDIWYEPDDASGMNYAKKMQVFNTVLHSEMETETSQGWIPTYFERYFEFVWDNRAIIRGFIDRIDVKDGEYRTVDYKTSKKSYDKSKLATSLQFGIYALAILNDFGKLPIESQYRFILLDKTQQALTKGWEKRLISKMTKIFDQIDECNKTHKWEPKSTPLCYWCDYCRQNPNAHRYKNECDYYLQWTPKNKTFKKNKEWDSNTVETVTEKRKLVF
jgi:hypothetical protein